jgi:glutamate formiminotransferase
MLQLTTTKTTTETRHHNSTEPATDVKTELSLAGKAAVEITSMRFSVMDGCGETNRTVFTYWGDNGEVVDAVVSYVAALERETKYGNVKARENLERILGAAGLSINLLNTASGES